MTPDAATNALGEAEIDVLTPSLNYAKFLPDAIASVNGQALPVRQLVQDAQSSDGTRALLDEAPASVDWISEFDNGQSDALNRALARAEADWIGWLNADEFYLPGALKALRDRAQAADCDVVFGDCVFVNEVGQVKRLVPGHVFSPRVLKKYGCFISSCTTLVRRAALLSLGWDTTQRRAMDWDLWLRLHAGGARFAYLPRTVAAFRVHGAQVTAKPLAEHALELAAIDELRDLPSGTLRRLRSSAEGHLEHAVLKVLSGSYARQVQASQLRGQDLRWWNGGAARAAAVRATAL